MSPTPVSMAVPTAPAGYVWEATTEQVAARYGVPVERIVRFDLNTAPEPPDIALAALAAGRFEGGLSEYQAHTGRQMVAWAIGCGSCCFGTPEFAVATLDALLKSRHPVVGVVPRIRSAARPRSPDDRRTRQGPRPRGRIAASSARTAGGSAFLDALAALLPDLGIVAAYGKILTDAVLAVPRIGLLNVHASLLPQYRGAAPIHRAIINGDRETGVTIMRVVKALDAGPMLADVRRPVGADETSEEVERDLPAWALICSSLPSMPWPTAGRRKRLRTTPRPPTAPSPHQR